ncbi:hypothetical protein BFP72_08790 [Reichenbachiella sp. 5M10]|nr:hypothetical protein BFP72_08790 [Reichenbachiella sp. 5M10]
MACLSPTLGQTTKAPRSTFIDIGLGLDFSNFRDFGTSPLVYSGAPKHVHLNALSFNKEKDISYGASFNFGNYSSVVGDQVALAQVKTLALYYMHLFEIKAISSDKWNIKAGGQLNTTGNFRINPSLQNAQLGYEVFVNIMGSAKVTLDLSRESEQSKKFLFIKYTAKPRKRDLSYNLNVGIVNNNARNGYNYISQDAVLNDAGLFKGYEINSFSGFRMSSQLAYTSHLRSSNNAFRYAYSWDMYKSGEDINPFEMAHHTLSFAFLFSIK